MIQYILEHLRYTLHARANATIAASLGFGTGIHDRERGKKQNENKKLDRKGNENKRNKNHIQIETNGH